MLTQYWANIGPADPILTQYWVNVSCLCNIQNPMLNAQCLGASHAQMTVLIDGFDLDKLRKALCI